MRSNKSHNSTGVSRRQFMQLSAALAAGSALPFSFAPASIAPQSSESSNILIILFDAFSAMHLSLLGYSRNTDSNIRRFAEGATVYHNHFAAGTFTTTGTASLLTGAYPFSHRAIHYADRVAHEWENQHIFILFEDYFRLGYSHNPLVGVFLRQFMPYLDELKQRDELYLLKSPFSSIFQQDLDIAMVSWARIIENDNNGANSLFLGSSASSWQKLLISSKERDFPRGLPTIPINHPFILEQAIDWAGEHLPELPQPFLTYLHFWPPHEPYNTRKEFVDVFKGDGFLPPQKPEHIFSQGVAQEKLDEYRQQYDEFILYLDAEFGRFYHMLLDSGLLENTWVILTSDHGEMFERGTWEHHNETMYQPLVHIPLMISAPKQQTRQDVYSATSAVDLLPTLLHLSGKPVPAWCQGTVLPPFGEAGQRAIFALDAKHNPEKLGPLTTVTSMLVEWPYKLVMYTGYDRLADNDPLYELYDLENDPEEMENLYPGNPGVVGPIIEKLMRRKNGD